MSEQWRDDLGTPLGDPGSAHRIVSLVPSLTEAVVRTCPERLVGATDWCTHPADLQVTRVRGTKNPNLGAIRELRPDLVIANKEENRALDVERLRESGITVWVTDIETVPGALASMTRLFRALAGGSPESSGAAGDDTASDPTWLVEARAAWSGDLPAIRGSVAVPIWRDPWMVVGGSTYAGDLLRRVGWRNAFDGPDRYPRVELAAIDSADVDLVLLPDEPYVFTESDGPEAFGTAPTRLVSGRLLTWYGPAMIEAWQRFSDLSAP